jgi:hypothetical protein
MNSLRSIDLQVEAVISVQRVRHALRRDLENLVTCTDTEADEWSVGMDSWLWSPAVHVSRNEDI